MVVESLRGGLEHPKGDGQLLGVGTVERNVPDDREWIG